MRSGVPSAVNTRIKKRFGKTLPKPFFRYTSHPAYCPLVPLANDREGLYSGRYSTGTE